MKAFMLQTNSLALSDPYRMELLEPMAVNHSPLYVIYALGAFVDGIDGVIYVQRILPLVMLPGILGLYRWILLRAQTCIFRDRRSGKRDA